MRCKIVSWVGNGNATRDITGIGFEPDSVWAKGGAQHTAWRTRSMITDNVQSCGWGGISATTAITEFLSDGFRINDNLRVNQLGTLYIGLVVARDGSGDFAEGYHDGTGSVGATANTGVSGQNIFVIKNGSGANAACVWTSAYPESESSIYANVANTTNGVTSVSGATVTLGSAANVNSAATRYYWISMVGLVGHYIGDGIDGLAAGLGGQAEIVFTKSEAAQNAYVRTGALGTDQSYAVNNSDVVTDAIKSITPTGIVLGNSVVANESGVDFYPWGLRESGRTLPIFVDYYLRRRTA